MVSLSLKRKGEKAKGKTHVFIQQSENKGPENTLAPWLVTVVFVSNSRLDRQGKMALGKQNTEAFTI